LEQIVPNNSFISRTSRKINRLSIEKHRLKAKFSHKKDCLD
jgi:hypothetical protein